MAGAAKEPLAGEQLAFLKLRLTEYCSHAAEAFLADRKRFEEAAARADGGGPSDRKTGELTREEKRQNAGAWRKLVGKAVLSVLAGSDETPEAPPQLAYSPQADRLFRQRGKVYGKYAKIFTALADIHRKLPASLENDRRLESAVRGMYKALQAGSGAALSDYAFSLTWLRLIGQIDRTVSDSWLALQDLHREYNWFEPYTLPFEAAAFAQTLFADFSRQFSRPFPV